MSMPVNMPIDSGPAATWPGPVGRPARQHWWSSQPPPPSAPIPAGRAYLEVLLVFAAFFAVGIIAGGEALAGRLAVESGSWAVFGPAALGELTTAGLAVTVTVLLSARRGITPRMLGFGLPRAAAGSEGNWPAFRMASWALIALIAGSLITRALTANALAEPKHLNGAYLLYATAASMAAGVVEETVVLAFVVTTLRQARRPLAEIVIVALALRCSYHDYYGPGLVGIAFWAVIFIWLFLRTGSIIPLIIVHFCWDASIFWSQQHHIVGVFAALAVLILLLASFVSWLADLIGGPGRGGPPGGGAQPYGYPAWPGQGGG